MKIGLKIKLQEFTKNSFKRMDSMKMLKNILKN